MYEILSTIEIYRNRTVRAYNILGSEHFEFYNKSTEELVSVGGYCLDAPEQLPTGSMRVYGRTDRFASMGLCSREWLSPEEIAVRKELADKLVDEILKEIDAEN